MKQTSMVVGNPKVFCIDIHDFEHELAYFVISIGGHLIGTLDDKSYVPSTIHALNVISENWDAHFASDGLIDDDAFNQFLSHPEKGIPPKHLLNLGDCFDDFRAVFYTCEKYIHFFWRLTERPFFKYPASYRENHAFKVPKSTFEEVLKQANENLPPHLQSE